MVRQWQEMFFSKRYASTEMINPDFVRLASAYGIKALAVSDREDLRPAVKTMLETDGPFILEAKVSREANIMPMVEPGASVAEVTLTYK